MKKKILITASVQSHVSQFLISHIMLLKQMGYEVHVAAGNDLHDKPGRELKAPDKVIELPFTRSPISLGNLRAYKQLKQIIKKENYNIVHCNTPACSVITRLAARKARKNGTRVFYTAHGFHFYKSAPLMNWLLYYTAEKIVAPLTDVLLTMNAEDYEISKRMGAKKCVYIPGVGVDVEKYSNVEVDRDKKRKELGVPEDAFFTISVGELIKRKNHSSAIRALAELKEYNIFHMICGTGMIEAELRDEVKRYSLEDRVLFGGYRKDLTEIYKSADFMIFPTYQEGLPCAVMEAMSAELPVICSAIRGNIDLIHNEKGGLHINPKDYKTIKEAIVRMIEKPDERTEFAKYSRNFINKFKVESVLEQLRKLYEWQEEK